MPLVKRKQWVSFSDVFLADVVHVLTFLVLRFFLAHVSSLRCHFCVFFGGYACGSARLHFGEGIYAVFGRFFCVGLVAHGFRSMSEPVRPECAARARAKLYLVDAPADAVQALEPDRLKRCVNLRLSHLFSCVDFVKAVIGAVRFLRIDSPCCFP